VTFNYPNLLHERVPKSVII